MLLLVKANHLRSQLEKVRIDSGASTHSKICVRDLDFGRKMYMQAGARTQVRARTHVHAHKYLCEVCACSQSPCAESQTKTLLFSLKTSHCFLRLLQSAFYFCCQKSNMLHKPLSSNSSTGCTVRLVSKPLLATDLLETTVGEATGERASALPPGTRTSPWRERLTAATPPRSPSGPACSLAALPQRQLLEPSSEPGRTWLALGKNVLRE